MIRMNGVDFKHMTLGQKLVSVVVILGAVGLFIVALPFLLGLIGLSLLVLLGVILWFSWKITVERGHSVKEFKRKSNTFHYEFSYPKDEPRREDKEEAKEEVPSRRRNQQDFRHQARQDYDDTIIDVKE